MERFQSRTRSWNFASYAALASLFSVGCIQQVAAENAQDKWWPSEWGAEDQKGSANRVTPERVLSALQLAREGKVYAIGQTYESGMPLFEGRDFKLLIGQDVPPSKNNLTAHIDYVSTELGQVGYGPDT